MNPIIGTCVSLRPLDNMQGRIVEIYQNTAGTQYSCRWFHNGEAKQALFFPDELGPLNG